MSWINYLLGNSTEYKSCIDFLDERVKATCMGLSRKDMNQEETMFERGRISAFMEIHKILTAEEQENIANAEFKRSAGSD